MPQKTRGVEDLLQDLMIIQLALAGVGQHQIRKIVGVDIFRVSRIAKLISRKGHQDE
jgi:hypothetical protein